MYRAGRAFEMSIVRSSLKSTHARLAFVSSGMAAVTAIAGGKLILHCFFNNRYGYFRDEFDYLACGDHLAWGYVDQPPLLPFLVRVSRIVLGDSLRSIRFLPALASSLTVVLAAMIARELGGGRFALLLTSVTVLVAPIYLSGGSLLTTNCLEPLFWMGCAYFGLIAIKRNPRYWLLFGISAGLGLEEKYSIAIFGLAIVIGLLLTRHRRVFLNKWFYAAGLIALLLFLPNVIWNVRNDWPFLELMHNIRAEGRDVQLSPLQFFLQQILLLHPFTAPIWISGLVALFLMKRFRDFRFLAWAYVISFAAFVLLKGKNYYLAPIYPLLFAAGAVVFETGIERTRRAWLKPALIALLIVGGVWFLPIVVPALPVDRFISYMNTLPFKLPRSEHSHERAILPQHYADQFGWEELATTSAQAWARVSESERADCGVFAQNYGQAGAIDFFGPRYGLPKALSGHQTYFLWGPRNYSGNCMIVIDDDKETLDKLFQQVEEVGAADNPYALERHVPVFLCRGAKFGTLRTLWPNLKRWR
jgi:4-amino-4-deoxy-L-arabinose transferase-like glycosyltransferase